MPGLLSVPALRCIGSGESRLTGIGVPFVSIARRSHLLAIWLVMASVLYRGLIPVGFMPATGEARRHGAVLMVCPHGQFSGHGAGGGHAGDSSLQQCPFGAAAAPAIPNLKAVHFFAPLPVPRRADAAGMDVASATHWLLPPARAPPALS